MSILQQGLDVLARRRAVQTHEHTLRTNDSLFDAGRDLRREAQAYLNAGRPDLAQPYIDEALLFESAATPSFSLSPRK